MAETGPDTDPKSRTGISQPPSNRLTPHVRPHVAGISHTFPSLVSGHLFPFALQAAFPPPLAGRYSRD
jgi:hypothetical protein